MNYKAKYNTALEKAKIVYHDHRKDRYWRDWLIELFPELKETESEDEKIRQAIIAYISYGQHCGVSNKDMIAWLEKQGNKSVNIDVESMVSSYEQRVVSQYNGVKNNPLVNICLTAFRHGIENVLEELNLKKSEKQKVTDEEIIFRPIVGTDIRIAARQALEKIDIGKKVVLAFNGAYIPVNGKTVGEIDSEYDAWLKKQSEQKSADKITPKFKVGDWIVFNGLILHIDEIVNGYYRTTSRGDGIHNSYDWNIDNAARLWTIQDAKDGDVLVDEDNFETQRKKFAMKSYTNLEQSQKLVEILPIETADMFYNEEPDETYPKDIVDTKYPMVIRKEQKHYLEEYGIPCWSSAALIEAMPKQLGRYALTVYWCDGYWCCSYIDDGSEIKEISSANNPVDACVEMILKLHKEKLL